MSEAKTALAAHPMFTAGLIATALGGVVGLALLAAPEARVAMPPLPEVPHVAPPRAKLVLVAPPAIPAHPAVDPRAPRAKELLLAFTVKHTAYARLADIESQDPGDGFDPRSLVMPRHGKVKLVDDDGVFAAIAPVAEADVPAGFEVWKDRAVKVDNHCTAKVTGFAVVSRLTGEPVYAGGSDDHWHANDVLSKGSAVLAARLDGCAGTADREIRYARDTDLADVVSLEPIKDKKLAAKAKAALIASPAGRDTQQEWIQFHPATRWETDEYTQFATEVLRHPRTGATFVSVHGTAEHACGTANVNVWGLFRVDDASGALVPLALRQLDPITTIDELLDIDGDGELEMLGHFWVGGDEILTRIDGQELDRVGLPYFGCPC